MLVSISLKYVACANLLFSWYFFATKHFIHTFDFLLRWVSIVDQFYLTLRFLNSLTCGILFLLWSQFCHLFKFVALWFAGNFFTAWLSCVGLLHSWISLNLRFIDSWWDPFGNHSSSDRYSGLVYFGICDITYGVFVTVFFFFSSSFHPKSAFIFMKIWSSLKVKRPIKLVETAAKTSLCLVC